MVLVIGLALVATTIVFLPVKAPRNVRLGSRCDGSGGDGQRARWLVRRDRRRHGTLLAAQLDGFRFDPDHVIAAGTLDGDHLSLVLQVWRAVDGAILGDVADSSPVTSASTSFVTRRMTPTGSREPAIEIHDLRKRYGRVEALAGLTMTVERGEVFGFLGPNGAGKTTTVKLLLGLARPTSGGGRLLGAPIGDLETRRRVGYLPELFRYQPWLRAREVLDLHADLIGLPHTDRRRSIDDALELVGLAERAGDLVGGFSKGMQQRLGLAVALIGRPELVFLDEPTSALDPLGRIDVRAIIRAVRERGTAVFLNSHLLTEVELVCDRVAIVARGRVVSEGRLDDVLGAPEVTIRLTGLDTGRLSALEAFGTPVLDGDRLTLRGMDLERVPDLVDALVHAGCRIHAVDAGRRSLEQRFIDLVGGDGSTGAAA